MRNGVLFIMLAIHVMLTGCSKSPKDEALSGIFDGCYITKNSELKKFCTCLVDGLDNSFENKFFEGSQNNAKAVLFQEKAAEISQICKQGINLR